MPDSTVSRLSALPAAVFDLSDRTVLRFTGADRLRYLNGQITQDLRRISPGVALPSCVTNAKGRLQALLWVSATEDALSVDSDPGFEEPLLARFERYIVADDVTLEDVSGKQGLLHVTGMDPTQIACLRDFSKIQANRLAENGWDVCVPLEQKEAVRVALGDKVGTKEDWEVLRVERGVPVWGHELGEDTLPPEAGLDRTHVDYHKGCYIGQEVISRLKSVGHVNRRLVRLRGAAGVVLPVCGAELQIAGAEGGAGVGRLTSAVRLQSREVAALAYLKRGVEALEFDVAGAGRFGRIDVG